MDNMFQDRRRKLDRLLGLRRSMAPTAEPGVRYIKCTDCLADHTEEALAQNLYLCPRCGAHLRMPARARLEAVLDGGTLKPRFGGVQGRDPLDFPGYLGKVAENQEKTGLEEAILCATGTIGGVKIIAAALDASFLMGSMGTAVGEAVTRCAEYALSNRVPLIIFTASGGARMQEGIFSLMQMAKTAAAVEGLNAAGGLFISCITHPTTGGVTASFASLGDIILAEPGALFGFAGPRVIEQTIGQKLPEGFQRSEFQLAHGFVDAVVPRSGLRASLIRLLDLHRR